MDRRACALPAAFVLAAGLAVAVSGCSTRGTQDPARHVRSVLIEGGQHVQVLEPAATNRSSITIVMVPGGGLSSAIYLGYDDRSWARRFSAAGYRVVLIDPPDETVAPRWSSANAFQIWGIDPDRRSGQMPSRFDVGDPERVRRLLASPSKALTASELERVLRAFGTTVVVGHSFGGKTVIEASGSQVDVVGIVLVEPVRCPTDKAVLRDVFVASDRAFLSIWGDNLERGAPPIIDRREACAAASYDIVDLGGNATIVDLPHIGIIGNSHLMMAEDNADRIADLILQWIARLQPSRAGN